MKALLHHVQAFIELVSRIIFREMLSKVNLTPRLYKPIQVA